MTKQLQNTWEKDSLHNLVCLDFSKGGVKRWKQTLHLLKYCMTWDIILCKYVIWLNHKQKSFPNAVPKCRPGALDFDL